MNIAFKELMLVFGLVKTACESLHIDVSATIEDSAFIRFRFTDLKTRKTLGREYSMEEINNVVSSRVIYDDLLDSARKLLASEEPVKEVKGHWPDDFERAI